MLICCLSKKLIITKFETILFAISTKSFAIV